jgi:multimeric flavodoxin WrbA
MRVIAFNGSARAHGNTADLIEAALHELRAAGIETETYALSGKQIRGCTACMRCRENKDRRCAVSGDVVNECIEKMLAADGILLGSPTYFADVSAELKALIDRAGMVAKVNEDMLRRKLGAAVVAVRRAGAVHAFDTINHFFLIGEMIVVGSSYWNLGIGRQPGDVQGDEEGLETMRHLGQNMAWLLKRLHSAT